MDTLGVAITNTGPIIALCGADRLELLGDLFERVLVPLPVMMELLAKQDAPEAARIVCLPNVQLRPVAGARPPEAEHLDPGESAAIALAVELCSDVVLLDEADARGVARALGLQVKGSLGVLLEAKRRGLLDAVEPVVERMVANGYRLAPDLVQRVLAAAGER